MLCYRADTLLAPIAHLYAACLNTGHLTSHWADLDFVIEQLGPSNLGLLASATIPSTALSAAKQYGLAFGVTAAEYFAERRRDSSRPPRIQLPEPYVIARRRIDFMPKAQHLSSFLMNEEGDLLGLSEIQKIERALQKVAQALESEPNSSNDDRARSTGKLEPRQVLSSFAFNSNAKNYRPTSNSTNFFSDASKFWRL